jgi:peroxiredoxin/nitroreductase
MRLFRRVPDFQLLSHEGKKVRFKEYFGRYVVLYFYPRANTPGCTREGKDFSGRVREFERLDAVVLGISPDRPETQAKFIQSRGLKVPMFSDTERRLACQFDVLDEKGRVVRSTFLIDRLGVLRWEWRGVKVEGHVDHVLKLLHAICEADREMNSLIQVRRARRALSSELLSGAEVNRLVEAAHLAPSCFNNQPWRFVVAQDDKLEEVKEALSGGNYWAKRAPVIIAVTSHRDLDCKLSDGRDYFLFCCGLAVENLVLQATQMGLIAHPIAGYKPLKVKEILDIPDDYVLITLLIIGKPGDIGSLSDEHRERELGERARKPLKEVVVWNRFSFDRQKK